MDIEEKRYIFSRAADAYQFIVNEDMLYTLVSCGLRKFDSDSQLIDIFRAYALSKNDLAFASYLSERVNNNLQLAEGAKKEVDSGFPTLLSHSSVSIWSSVEAFFEDLLSWFIDGRGDARSAIKSKYPGAKIKQNQKATHVITEWDKALDGRLAAERMVEMVKFFLPKYEIDSDRIYTMSELSEVRNVILHRMGIVDNRFIEKVPHTNFKVGERVVISEDIYKKYYDSCAKFTRYFLDPKIYPGGL